MVVTGQRIDNQEQRLDSVPSDFPDSNHGVPWVFRLSPVAS
jgi:hypothetical protein